MEPYLGEIRLFGGNFAPSGWAFCNGQQLPVAQYSALFSLIGTSYGGDGRNTFCLPDLRGRLPLHMGSNLGESFALGERGGEETVPLLESQLPRHSHGPLAEAEAGDLSSPAKAVWAQPGADAYSTTAPDTTMAAQAVSPAGAGQPHQNMMPSKALSFIICLAGIYPSSN
ncbi:MAG: tail fiber protein [Alcanivorax sp.]|nr:tail fiber protein [Alcanivorax sp.]